jgi:hypothetical protein
MALQPRVLINDPRTGFAFIDSSTDPLVLDDSKKLISFVRGCDICKDAYTGKSVYIDSNTNKMKNTPNPQQQVNCYFSFICGDNLWVTMNTPANLSKLHKTVGKYAIPKSISLAETTGKEIEDEIMANDPNCKKYTNDIDLANANLQDIIKKFTIDCVGAPRIYRHRGMFLAKTSPDYVMTIGTILDPVPSTPGTLETIPFDLTDDFLKTSGFLSGNSLVSVTNINNKTNVRMPSYTVCGTDFLTASSKEPGSTSFEKLKSFCTTGNPENALKLKDPTLSYDIKKAYTLAKECGDTFQSAILNRTWNDDYKTNNMTLFTCDKGTMFSCMLYRIPCVLNITQKKGQPPEVYYYKGDITITYNDLIKLLDNQFTSVMNNNKTILAHLNEYYDTENRPIILMDMKLHSASKLTDSIDEQTIVPPIKKIPVDVVPALIHDDQTDKQLKLFNYDKSQLFLSYIETLINLITLFNEILQKMYDHLKLKINSERGKSALDSNVTLEFTSEFNKPGGYLEKMNTLFLLSNVFFKFTYGAKVMYGMMKTSTNGIFGVKENIHDWLLKASDPISGLDLTTEIKQINDIYVNLKKYKLNIYGNLSNVIGYSGIKYIDYFGSSKYTTRRGGSMALDSPRQLIVRGLTNTEIVDDEDELKIILARNLPGIVSSITETFENTASLDVLFLDKRYNNLNLYEKIGIIVSEYIKRHFNDSVDQIKFIACVLFMNSLKSCLDISYFKDFKKNSKSKSSSFPESILSDESSRISPISLNILKEYQSQLVKDSIDLIVHTLEHSEHNKINAKDIIISIFGQLFFNRLIPIYNFFYGRNDKFQKYGCISNGFDINLVMKYCSIHIITSQHKTKIQVIASQNLLISEAFRIGTFSGGMKRSRSSEGEKISPIPYKSSLARKIKTQRLDEDKCKNLNDFYDYFLKFNDTFQDNTSEKVFIGYYNLYLDQKMNEEMDKELKKTLISKWRRFMKEQTHPDRFPKECPDELKTKSKHVLDLVNNIYEQMINLYSSKNMEDVYYYEQYRKYIFETIFNIQTSYSSIKPKLKLDIEDYEMNMNKDFFEKNILISLHSIMDVIIGYYTFINNKFIKTSKSSTKTRQSKKSKISKKSKTKKLKLFNLKSRGLIKLPIIAENEFKRSSMKNNSTSK